MRIFLCTSKADGILNVRKSVASSVEIPHYFGYREVMEPTSDSRMDAISDSRFDPNIDPKFPMALLLEIARERSLENLLEKIVRGAAALPATTRYEIWLIEKGDCCLHLAAAANNPLEGIGGVKTRLPDSSVRIPLGEGVIGKTAVTGQQTVLRDLYKEPGEFCRLDWLTRELVRGFAATAISFKGEIMGVITTFARVNLPEEARAWTQIMADHIGAAIANARAFEEIERLKAQLEMENAYLQEEVVEARAFGSLVGQCASLRHIVSQIDLVAPTEASVLILGDTGTGKELVAREIHHRSRRKGKPLIRVNCASIPKDLYESEFFGHARGAFTGAIKDRAGRFEMAEGGTIFLDEIGEIPLDLQSKLLRVLQEKCYERVGEDRTRLADVRIVGATNRDLKQDVATGRFREDLYYRLNVFPIQVPSLKERADDIPLLARHFMELSVKELRCSKPRLTRAGVAKLQSYDWPGNIRELRNVIERAVIISRGGALDFDLPVRNSPPPLAAREATSSEPEILTEPELQRRERENLLAALHQTNWKIRGADGASELLGVKPTTLVTRMKKWGLQRPV
jgi:transcriptional regulator with GAF, ATPase, and Fis domain